MLNPADAEGVPAGAPPVPSPVEGVVHDRPASLAQQALVDFLEAHLALQGHLGFDGSAGWKHRSVYDLVATHGRWFTPAPLPTEVRPLPERRCFANASTTEREHPHLAYTEGFAVAVDSPVPTAHAWCTDLHGRVIDPTWYELGGSAYLGIRLPAHLRPRAPRNWGVLEAPDSLYPLLRSGL
ncbi:hypothetical protein [Streptomyces parvulus]|uniref:hypothetical protein n=1 Tax=Streptomyces parvulus TaxID=146923 RepID=UPI00381DE472